MPDGTVYLAALGGATAKRAQAANLAAPGNPGSGAAVTSSGTTLTVEAHAPETNPPAPPKPQQNQPGAAAPSTPQVSTQFTPVVDVSGVEKSAVYRIDRKSTRLNSSHLGISYAVFCLKKKKKNQHNEDNTSSHDTLDSRTTRTPLS